MVSIWWMLLAFLVGGYAGAILVGVMSMAGRADDSSSDGRNPRVARAEPPRRRHHPAAASHPWIPGLH